MKRRRNKSQWQELIAEQSRSGMSQAEFCKAQSLSLATFQWRKKELRAQERKAAFTEVVVAESSPDVKAELVLPGGATFRLSW